MTKIKSHSKFFAVFMAMSLLLFSCSKDVPLTEESSSLSAKYSSKDMFEALYFYDGKLANDMPSIDSKFINKTLESLKEIDLNSTEGKGQSVESEYERYIKFKDYIFGYIEENHPDKLSEFTIKMSSGDHYEIIEASSDLSELYIEAILASAEYAPDFQAVWEKVPDLDTSLFVNKDGEFNFEYFEANLENIKSHLSKLFDTTANINFVTVLMAAVVVVVVAVAGYGVLIGAGAAVVTWVAVGDKMKKGNGYNFSIQNEMMVNDFAELLSN